MYISYTYNIHLLLIVRSSSCVCVRGWHAFNIHISYEPSVTHYTPTYTSYKCQAFNMTVFSVVYCQDNPRENRIIRPIITKPDVQDLTMKCCKIRKRQAKTVAICIEHAPSYSCWVASACLCLVLGYTEPCCQHKRACVSPVFLLCVSARAALQPPHLSQVHHPVQTNRACREWFESGCEEKCSL